MIYSEFIDHLARAFKKFHQLWRRRYIN